LMDVHDTSQLTQLAANRFITRICAAALLSVTARLVCKCSYLGSF
jgi:hypothetical protein